MNGVDAAAGGWSGGVADAAGRLPRSAGALAWPVIIVLAMAALLVDRCLPSELIQPLSPDVWAGIVFLFVLLIVLAAGRMLTRGPEASIDGISPRRRRGRVDLLVGGPVVLFLSISAAARLALQVAGFAGLHTPAVPVPFEVVATANDPSHGSHHYRLSLRYGDRGRTFSDPVGQATFAAARVGDTVVLPVQTGRFGLQRALLNADLSPADLRHADPPAR